MKRIILSGFVSLFSIFILKAQLINDNCQYSHRSVYMDFDHFSKGERASTIESKGENVYISDDVKIIRLEGVVYNVSNPEYFDVPEMDNVEQVIFDADKEAISIGITKNNGLLVITILRSLNNEYLEQESYTFANKTFVFDEIIKILFNSKIKLYTNNMKLYSRSKISNKFNLDKIWDIPVTWLFEEDSLLLIQGERTAFDTKNKILKVYINGQDDLVLYADFPISKYLLIKDNVIIEYYYKALNKLINNYNGPFIFWDGNDDKIYGFNKYEFDSNVEDSLRELYLSK